MPPLLPAAPLDMPAAPPPAAFCPPADGEPTSCGTTGPRRCSDCSRGLLRPPAAATAWSNRTPSALMGSSKGGADDVLRRRPWCRGGATAGARRLLGSPCSLSLASLCSSSSSLSAPPFCAPSPASAAVSSLAGGTGTARGTKPGPARFGPAAPKPAHAGAGPARCTGAAAGTGPADSEITRGATIAGAGTAGRAGTAAGAGAGAAAATAGIGAGATAGAAAAAAGAPAGGAASGPSSPSDTSTRVSDARPASSIVTLTAMRRGSLSSIAFAAELAAPADGAARRTPRAAFAADDMTLPRTGLSALRTTAPDPPGAPGPSPLSSLSSSLLIAPSISSPPMVPLPGEPPVSLLLPPGLWRAPALLFLNSGAASSSAVGS